MPPLRTAITTTNQSSAPESQQPGTRTTEDNDSGAAGPRKRRKRNVFSGAADDCFTCARRQVQCDRERPYCNQCLDSGAACAGYKTTLTWGVGVASRGKLRGQFLPVSGAEDSVNKSPPVQPSAPSNQEDRTRQDASGSQEPSHDTRPMSSPGSTATKRQRQDALQPMFNLESNRQQQSRTPLRIRPPGGPRSFPYIAQPTHSSLPGKTARIRYLLGYYSEVIAPVIVAFDSPTNPYRTTILELAAGSETLQHAVCALVLSNLRQRRNQGLSTGKTLPSRQSAQAHCRLTDASNEEFSSISPDEHMREETFHKVMTFKSVNAQLADPVQWQDDALVATLLILCLFHMCDTGVANFREQFAGVKKLLALRNSRRRNRPDATTWITRMFTWLDAMTASINDRESHMNGRYLDMATSTCDDEWTLENLLGCDAGLFKLVAQMGRISMLSQQKQVYSDGAVNTPVPTAAVPPSLIHYQPTSHPTTKIPLPSQAGVHTADSRTAFWREWQAIRQQLESWRVGMVVSSSTSNTTLSSSSPSSSSPSTPTPSPNPVVSTSPTTSSSRPQVHPTNVTDLSNISEAFRYSALLYLERLAHPHIPSAHPRIQTIVSTALHYINAVKSDVSLLWPLFVTGAECTSETDRAAVRKRCEDIQKDSGFVNNLSCLRLLERIWAGEEPGKLDGSGAASFRWQGLLGVERAGAEFIVV